MRTVIEVDGLFDGTRVVANAAVVIEDGAVLWSGARRSLPRTPRGERSETVRAPGSFLLPGLVNCHAHLTLDGGPDIASEARQSDATAALKAFRNARNSLHAGVTTVRDLGANGAMVVDLGRAIARGAVEGPRIVAAAKGITTTGGHGFEVGRQADGADEVRKAVREQLFAGAGAIKLFSTGGVLGDGAHPEVSQFTPEETRAAVEEAHKAGVRVTTHAHAGEGVRIAAEAGVDSIEHGTLMDAKLVRLLKERGVAYVPTRSALDAILANAGRLDPGIVERARQVADRHLESIDLARRAGVTIATGTDSGTPFNRHEDFARELDLLVEAGLTRLAALVAATRVAADVVGLPRAGRLVAGSWADLLFVTGDPLRDLAPLHAPKGVWVGGAAVAQGARG